MTSLSVNINKIATLRNQRAGEVPSVLKFASIALNAGAHGITVHPRPDERHIRGSDLAPLSALCKARKVEFNIEGNPLEGRWMEQVLSIRPDQATLVPDANDQMTSDHGFPLDPATVAGQQSIAQLQTIVDALQAVGCRVSLFVDPDPKNAEGAKLAGADRIELYTEGWAHAFAQGGAARDAMLAAYAATAKEAQVRGLGVNAGHDLNLFNLRPFLAGVPHVAEVSIGHALTADALELGMAESVKQYLACCR
jgi:pyridoxine 5-phosphate synthase